MNAGQYEQWMAKAFLYVEAALATEFATPSRVCVSEEYFRTALVRGLSHSEPSKADRIATEYSTRWAQNACWHDTAHKNTGQRRPIQHDVVVTPDDTDNGLVCEVKWLKQAKGKEVMQDIWKLALSRSTAVESKAVRTYLLIGGEAKPFSDTFSTLQKNNFNLRWSIAVRTPGPPVARTVSLYDLYKSPTGRNALLDLLAWSDHHRSPPDCWRQCRVIVRQQWLRTLSGIGWRTCLFEFTHRGTSSTSEIPWDTIQSKVIRKC
jgi:hypothetical protein